MGDHAKFLRDFLKALLFCLHGKRRIYAVCFFKFILLRSAEKNRGGGVVIDGIISVYIDVRAQG